MAARPRRSRSVAREAACIRFPDPSPASFGSTSPKVGRQDAAGLSCAHQQLWGASRCVSTCTLLRCCVRNAAPRAVAYPPPPPPAIGPTYAYSHVCTPPDPADHHRQQQRVSFGGSAGAARAGSQQPARSGSASFRVPDSDGDDDSDGGADSDSGATSGLRGPAARPAAAASSGGRRRPADPVHAVHLARTRQLKQQVEARFNSSTQQLQQELLQIEVELVQQLERVALEAEDKQVRILAGYFSFTALCSILDAAAPFRRCLGATIRSSHRATRRTHTQTPKGHLAAAPR